MKNQTKVLLCAYEKGYKVLPCGTVKSHKDNILKLCDNGRGYLKFGVGYEGRSRTVLVHRLMAYQKFGEQMFENGIDVRHLNNNKYDNSDSNIAIGTRVENCADKTINSKLAGPRVLRKLTYIQANKIRLEYKEGNITQMELGKKYNVARQTITSLINFKTYNCEE